MDSVFEMISKPLTPLFYAMSKEEPPVPEADSRKPTEERRSGEREFSPPIWEREIPTPSVDHGAGLTDANISNQLDGFLTEKQSTPRPARLYEAEDNIPDNEAPRFDQVPPVEECGTYDEKLKPSRPRRSGTLSPCRARNCHQAADTQARGDRLADRHKYSRDSPKKPTVTADDQEDELSRHLMRSIDDMPLDESVMKPSQACPCRQTINRPVTLKTATEDVDEDIDVISTSSFSFNAMKMIDDIDEHDYISRSSFAYNVKSNGSPPKALCTPGFPENEPFFYKMKRGRKNEKGTKRLKDDRVPIFSPQPLNDSKPNPTKKASETKDICKETHHQSNERSRISTPVSEINKGGDNVDVLQIKRRKRAFSVESQIKIDNAGGRVNTKRCKRNKACHGRNKRAQSTDHPIYISDSNKNVAKPSFPGDDPNSATRKKTRKMSSPSPKKIYIADRYGNSGAFKCSVCPPGEDSKELENDQKQSTPEVLRFDEDSLKTNHFSDTRDFPQSKHIQSTTAGVNTSQQEECSQKPFHQRLQNLISKTLILGERSLADRIFTPQKLALPRWNTCFGDSYFSTTTPSVPEKEKLLKPAIRMKKPISCPVHRDPVKPNNVRDVREAKQPSVPTSTLQDQWTHQAMVFRCMSNISQQPSVYSTDSRREKPPKKISTKEFKDDIVSRKLSSKSSTNQLKNLPCINTGCPSFQTSKKKSSNSSRRAPDPTKRVSRIDF